MQLLFFANNYMPLKACFLKLHCLYIDSCIDRCVFEFMVHLYKVVSVNEWSDQLLFIKTERYKSTFWIFSDL